MNDLTAPRLGLWLHAFADYLDENHDLLSKLDAAIGDADHGANMSRGAAAIREFLATEPASPREVFSGVGEALLEGIGGAAGPLYASMFFGAVDAVDDATEISTAEFAGALVGGVDALAARGRAELGDKTMFDAAQPGAAALRSALLAGGDFAAAAAESAAAANAGRANTEPLQARKGRASYLGPRSVGHIDPGATSAAYLFDALSAMAVPTA